MTFILCQAYGLLWTMLASQTGPRSNGALLKISATWSTSTCLAASGPLLHFYLLFVPPKVSLNISPQPHILIVVIWRGKMYSFMFPDCCRSDGLHVKHLFFLQLPEYGSIQCVKERTGGLCGLPKGWNGQFWCKGAETLQNHTQMKHEIWHSEKSVVDKIWRLWGN